MPSEIVGNNLDFRAMLYTPINEQGVVVLFALICKDLDFKIETIQTGFPDCTAHRKIGPDKNQRVRIEFELNSRNFLDHGHNPKECDIIVCWKHDWKDYPKGDVEIISLYDEIQEIEKIERKSKEEFSEELTAITEENKEIYNFFFQRNLPTDIRKLLFELKSKIDEAGINYVLNVVQTAITFRNKGKNFLYTMPQVKQIKLYFRVNPEIYEFLTPLHNEVDANWPEFKLNVDNKDMIPKFIPIFKEAIENIETVFRILLK